MIMNPSTEQESTWKYEIASLFCFFDVVIQIQYNTEKITDCLHQTMKSFIRCKRELVHGRFTRLKEIICHCLLYSVVGNAETNPAQINFHQQESLTLQQLSFPSVSLCASCFAMHFCSSPPCYIVKVSGLSVDVKKGIRKGEWRMWNSPCRS